MNKIKAKCFYADSSKHFMAGSGRMDVARENVFCLVVAKSAVSVRQLDIVIRVRQPCILGIDLREEQVGNSMQRIVYLERIVNIVENNWCICPGTYFFQNRSDVVENITVR